MKVQCNKCAYSCPVNVGENGRMLTACVYILRTGKRRPCKPGKACAAYLPKAGGVR